MIVRKVTQDEMVRVNQLFNIAFEMSFNGEPCITAGSGVQSWAAFDSGKMMSTFTTNDYQIRFDGNSCKMAGLGGVATLPQYRRMGGIRECFNACLPALYKEGYDFSYLYPFSTGYYRKFGYECCVQKLLVSVDLGLLKPAVQDGHFVLCEADNPMKEAIQEIDRFWEDRYNIMVIHGDQDYKWTEKFDPAEKLDFTYIYFDAEDHPLSYCSFRMENQPEGRNLQCSRFYFKNRSGFDGLMQLFKSMAADHRFVKFQLPAGCSMEYLMPEWSMGAAQWSVENAGMVRVINVVEVLKKARYQGSGSLTVEIEDPQIPENNGVCTVTFADGKALSVKKNKTAPDLKLSISAFSALIAGALPFRDAADYLSGVRVLTPSKAAEQVFYKKPMMIADYF